LQPDPNCYGLGIDGLMADPQRKYGRPALCPAASGGFSVRDITCGGPSVAFPRLRRRTILHLDAPHDANTADLTVEFYIVASRLDVRDSQALVVINHLIPIILALFGASFAH
jgi:hypothetical protein